MRKILTKEEQEKKGRRNKITIGLILVGLMVLSTAGYAFFSGERQGGVEKIEYNGVKFILGEDSLWHSSINSIETATQYNPKDTENITISGFFNLENYREKTVYFSYDSNKEGINEILKNLGGIIERTQYACIEECKEEWPVKSCETDRIIIINEANQTLIKQEKNCIFIYAEKDEILRASDAFIFKIFGI